MPRAPKPLDLAQLEKIASLQCTIEEAAAWFGFSKRGFLKRLESKQARAAWDNGKEKGKISLRRAQFTAALKGDRTMLVWLGKQILEQKDEVHTELTGAHGGPVEVRSSDRDELISRIAGLVARQRPAGDPQQPQ